MADTNLRRAVPSELGVAALVAASAIPVGRLFRTGNIEAVSIAAAAASTAVAWGLRRLRAPTLVSVVASVAAFLWFASVAFFGEATLGPFPTPGSLSMIWDAVVEGIRRSQSDVAPVAATDPFLCLTAFAVWATAWLADDAAIKLRHPMLAIGVTVPLYVLPGTILESIHRWVDAGLYLSASLWVLFQDERFRLSRWGRVVGSGVPGWRPGLAARMGAVAIILALVATPILPGFGAPPGLRGVTGSGRRTTLNPLVSIKPQLGRPEPVDVFTVRTRASSYWRLTALDRFDGVSWTSGAQHADLSISGRTIEPQNPASRIRVVQDVQIQALGGPWMPAAYEPIRVDGVRGVGADATSRTLISPDDLRDGMKYKVTSRLPRLSYEELNLVPAIDDLSLRRYLQLPAAPQTQLIERIARSVVAAANAPDEAPFRQAVALQRFLRTFNYDENVALKHTITDLADFLTRVRTGYCEQFATAMAVMARTLGLPSRVAIGFAGGDPFRGGTDEFVVTSRNAHAWVEILFPLYGWVQFEPTPRSDSVVVPSYTSPTGVSPGQTASPTPEASEEPSPEPTETAPREGIDPEIGAREVTGAAGRLVPVGIGAAALLLPLVITFPVASRVRRVARRRGARSAQDKVTLRYLDFLDWCAAAGVGRGYGETPLEHARRLAEVPPGSSPESSSDENSAAQLAGLALDAVYAPPNGTDPAGAARLSRAARAEMTARLSRKARILSFLGWAWWRRDPASRSKAGIARRAERVS